MSECPFCKIVSKEMKAFVLSENETMITFLSLENHPLVVPKKHIKDIYELDETTGTEIMKALVKTAQIVKKGMKCDGIYITQANESAAGQDVFHIHFHVYPRWKDEAMNQVNKVTEEERKSTHEKLKEVS